MSELLKAELIRQLERCEEKWENRRKLEMELGIPTSDHITAKFIKEETAEIMRIYTEKSLNNMIKKGELFGNG